MRRRRHPEIVAMSAAAEGVGAALQLLRDGESRLVRQLSGGRTRLGIRRRSPRTRPEGGSATSPGSAHSTVSLRSIRVPGAVGNADDRLTDARELDAVLRDALEVGGAPAPGLADAALRGGEL